MRKLITAAMVAALGMAVLASTAEAGFRYRRDGTPRLPTKVAKAAKAVAGCHCHR